MLKMLDLAMEKAYIKEKEEGTLWLNCSLSSGQ